MDGTVISSLDFEVGVEIAVDWKPGKRENRDHRTQLKTDINFEFNEGTS